MHDPGNTVLMLPAAAVDVARNPDSGAGPPDHTSAFLISMTYVLFACAALLAFLYALRDQFADPRHAGVALLVFVFATAYAAYQKTGWDVLGGCLGSCFAIAAAVAIRRRAETERPIAAVAVALGASLSLTAAFRITWAPFLAIALFGMLAVVRMPNLWRAVGWAGGSALLFALPQLAYDTVRTGNPFQPHTTSYEVSSFSGNLLDDLSHYLVAPKFGLLFYCPIFLLFLVPLVHRRCRWPTWPPLLAVFLYALLVATSRLTTQATWGPRYFIPALPILFFVLAPGIGRMLARSGWRVVALGVVGISLVLSVTALLIPWKDDLDTWHGGEAVIGASAWSLDRLELAGDALLSGVTGERTEHGFLPQDGRDITEGQGFPDFWWVSAIAQGGLTRLLGAAMGLALILLFTISSRELWRRYSAWRPPPGPPIAEQRTGNPRARAPAGSRYGGAS